MTLLVTGFDPFPGAPANPSGDLVASLVGLPPPAPFAAVAGLVLPTVYGRAGQMVADALADLRPRAVLMFGLAVAAQSARLERFAVNVMDASLPDNAGVLARGLPIDPAGPAARQAMLDLEALRLRLAGLSPALGVSNHAGAYVCNDAYYRALGAAAALPTPPAVVFVHLPAAYDSALLADPLEPTAETHIRVALAIAAAVGDAIGSDRTAGLV